MYNFSQIFFLEGHYYSCSDDGNGGWTIVDHYCNDNLAFDQEQQKCTWEQDVPGCSEQVIKERNYGKVTLCEIRLVLTQIQKRVLSNRIGVPLLKYNH